MPRIVIVGGGISGLAVAYRLQQRLPQAEIVLLERDVRPGGTITTRREQGFVVELGPNGFLDTKPTTLTLCRDLGLGDQLMAASESSARHRYLFLGDRLRALPGGMGSFLFSGLLSWRGKLNIFLERFRKLRRPQGDESIDAFVHRRAGPEAARILADALVTGIYAGDPRLLSLAACFPRLAEYEQQHGSVMKGFAAAARQRRAEAQAKGVPYQRPGKMWSFRQGLGLMVDTLMERMATKPLLGVAVRRLAKEGPEQRPTWTVQAEGRDSWSADAVVLACPAHQQAGQLAALDNSLAEEIAGIPYNRVAVVALGFRHGDLPRPLDGFGYISPQNLGRDVLGVQWCSSIFPGRAPEGTVLMRAMCGGWRRAEMVGWNDERLLQSVRAELRLALKISAAPIFHTIVRWDRAIPQYHLGHLERVGRIDSLAAAHPGLFLTGNAYRGVAMNDCTEQGTLVAEKVANYLARQG